MNWARVEKGVWCSNHGKLDEKTYIITFNPDDGFACHLCRECVREMELALIEAEIENPSV